MSKLCMRAVAWLALAMTLVGCGTVNVAWNNTTEGTTVTTDLPIFQRNQAEVQERRLTPAGKNYYIGPGGIPLADAK